MQLRIIAAVTLMVGVAHADGSLTARGVYYKEKSTRVIQPMLDGMFDVGEKGLFTGHFLVDSITSASAAAGAGSSAAFTERRYEAAGGYTHQLTPNLKVGGDAKFSTESDYRSIYLGVRGQLDLAQKNASIAAGFGVSFDNVTTTTAGGLGAIMIACDPHDLQVTAAACDLTTYSGFASASQVLGKNAIAAVTYDIADLRGFQANPYRLVVADGLVSERHPDKRLRQAVSGSIRYYLASSETTFIGAYRYYTDNWDIHAHTPELRIVQQVGDNADAGLAYRYYTQSASFFFKSKYTTSDPTMQEFLTADPKMSAFDGHTVEAKLGIYGREFGLEDSWAGARFEGILQYVIQHNSFGNAVVAHIALTLPFNY